LILIAVSLVEAQGKLEDAQETREEVERLKEQVAEFKEAYGQYLGLGCLSHGWFHVLGWLPNLWCC
jgi:hypothetical protein